MVPKVLHQAILLCLLAVTNASLLNWTSFGSQGKTLSTSSNEPKTDQPVNEPIAPAPKRTSSWLGGGWFGRGSHTSTSESNEQTAAKSNGEDGGWFGGRRGSFESLSTLPKDEPPASKSEAEEMLALSASFFDLFQEKTIQLDEPEALNIVAESPKPTEETKVDHIEEKQDNVLQPKTIVKEEYQIEDPPPIFHESRREEKNPILIDSNEIHAENTPVDQLYILSDLPSSVRKRLVKAAAEEDSAGTLPKKTNLSVTNNNRPPTTEAEVKKSIAYSPMEDAEDSAETTRDPLYIQEQSSNEQDVTFGCSGASCGLLDLFRDIRHQNT